MLKIYLIGLCVLLVAILANVFAGKLGIITWYDFGSGFFRRPLIAIQDIGILNILWLFLLYPFILGLAYIIGEKLYNLL